MSGNDVDWAGAADAQVWIASSVGDMKPIYSVKNAT